MVQKRTNSRNSDEWVDSSDEFGDYSDPDLNAPKHSPMRRKAKFRTPEFQGGKKNKDRKRGLRNKIRDDFEF